jgi:hypothetical protein
MPPASARPSQRMLRTSIVVSALLLLLYFFEWSIIDVVTPFLFIH